MSPHPEGRPAPSSPSGSSATPARYVRLARSSDLDQLVSLATAAEGHLTTLPRERDHMAERLALATASADPGRTVDGTEVYLFVLVEAGEIVGISSIFAAVGLERPFFSYKLTRHTKFAPDLGWRVEFTTLVPCNDYTGFSEVGTLYLPRTVAAAGGGRLLSLVRFLFFASQRDRFGDQVMAEMRGWTDGAGRSPFWDAVGKRFFGLDLDEADRLSGREYRFIHDLLPGSPIHVDLLPSEAREVVGRVHPGAAPAAALLRRQGFRDHGYVDIFDGGLSLDAYIDDLDAVREAVDRPVVGAAGATAATSGVPALAARADLAAFAMAEVELTDEGLILDAAASAALGARPGDLLLSYPLERARTGTGAGEGARRGESGV